MDDLTRGMAGIEAAQLMKENAPIWLTQIAPASQVSTAIAASEPSPERMRREFARFFEALSIVRPVILFLDDLHWTDASTCDLLAYLGSRIKDFRILIITTYRPSKLFGPHPFLSVLLALERKGSCQEIPLEFLTLGDVECYLNRRFPGNTFLPEFINVVQERTEGNPLFMTDMLSFLLDRKILIDQAGHWRLNREIADIRKLIPTGTQSMIRLQIDQFGDGIEGSWNAPLSRESSLIPPLFPGLCPSIRQKLRTGCKHSKGFIGSCNAWMNGNFLPGLSRFVAVSFTSFTRMRFTPISRRPGERPRVLLSHNHLSISRAALDAARKPKLHCFPNLDGSQSEPLSIFWQPRAMRPAFSRIPRRSGSASAA